jgi:hypothetical protein
LTNPASANYVAPAERSPIAVQLLQAFPQPNAPPLTPGASAVPGVIAQHQRTRARK